MTAFLKRQTFARLAVSACLLALVSACASNPDLNADAGTRAAGAVSGELVYRQRIALSPDAVVNLRLLDAGHGKVLAEQTIRPEGKQVPIAFSLGTPENLKAATAPELVATIRDGQGNLRWLADVPVEADAHTGMQVVLNQAGVNNDELVGSKWQLLRIDYADGSIDRASGEQSSTIVFGTNGEFNGQAACNGFFGSYELQQDGALQFGNAGATLMACGSDNIASQFLQTLAKVNSYAMTGKRLHLQAGDAVIVLALDAQP